MRVLTVDEVTGYLKELVEYDPILGDLWIRGEVTSLSVAASGHAYFSLASDDQRIDCVLFRNQRLGLFVEPLAGEVVLVHGRIAIYAQRSTYQIIVDNVVPEGVGPIQLMFEAVRAELEAEGLFAQERKRPLPGIPSVIGVVTSESGAVWHDIQTVIRRRFPHTTLVLAPSAVQGPDAPNQLIDALQRLTLLPSVDVVIIGRGGGSPEDLAAFNDPQLARAIFASPWPVVSAVGHETDHSIADLVADLRAATPSVAAEMVVPDAAQLLAEIASLSDRSRRVADRRIEALRVQHERLARRLERHRPQREIEDTRQRIDWLIDRARRNLELQTRTLSLSAERLAQRATAVNPAAILARGYAVVQTDDADNRRVTTAADAQLQPRLTLTFADGQVPVGVAPDKETT